jgi:hypothetical protein
MFWMPDQVRHDEFIKFGMQTSIEGEKLWATKDFF